MVATMPPKPSFVRVHDRELSLWQSSVAETVKKELATASTNVVLGHSRMQAVNAQVLLETGQGFDALDLAVADDTVRQAYLGHVAFQLAREAAASGNTADAAQLAQAWSEQPYVKFSDDDKYGWLSCVATYVSYDTGQPMKYNDWTVQGDNKLSYGVIDYVVPADGKVAIIGDWGTGLNDAQCLLQDIVTNHAPSAIVHLGDIYYSGTPTECTDSFVNIVNTVYGDTRTVPVFTIPGNHDYYDWGVGFYGMVSTLNSVAPNVVANAVQEASYFCLRTADGAWQFLGMDTGFNDSNPKDALDPWVDGPALQASEIAWHLDKLNNFSGTTILLSHHQLFTTNGKINGDLAVESDVPYLNTSLYGTFWDYFSTNVALWLWGHEHNFAMYENGLWGLAKGRLLGCSAYEEFGDETVYQQNYPQVSYNLPLVELGTNANDGTTFYNHAYAIIDFSASPPTITYYQYPAFYTGTAPAGSATVMATETIIAPEPPSQGPVTSDTTVRLLSQEALYIGPVDSGDFYYYPTMTPYLDAPGTSGNASAIGITVSTTAGGNLADADVVYLTTSESAVGNANCIGTEQFDGSCVYVTAGSGSGQWVLRKANIAAGATINMYDRIYFIDPSTAGSGAEQYLSADPDDGTFYLTTSGTPYYWRVLPS